MLGSGLFGDVHRVVKIDDGKEYGTIITHSHFITFCFCSHEKHE